MITPPKTKKLFISYRSSDAAKVDKIARDLALLKHDDGTPRYLTWQDKHNLPPASPNWWDAIVDAITDCDVFVFHLSRESLQSPVCRAELDYAHKRNRPIIPVVLEGEFALNVKSGKYDLPAETWTLVPDWLRDRQFLFYIGADFFTQFEKAIGVFEHSWPRDLPAPRPLNPDETSAHGSNHALYDAACDYAERLAFSEAENLFSTLVTRNDRDYADFAAQWIEIIRKYAELIEIASRRSARVILKARMAEYRALFPKVFMDGDIFDPKGLTAGEPAPEEVAEQERRAAEQAKADRLAAEKAEADRLAAEKAEADRLAAEKVEADRIAAEKAKIITDHIAALEDINQSVRWKAVAALTKIGEPAIESLINALKKGNMDARSGAAEALGKIGKPAIEPLIDVLKKGNVDARGWAALALGNIKDVCAVEPLIAALQDKSSSVRGHVVRALSRVGDPRAVEPLIAVLEDESWLVSWYAAIALGEIKDARAVPALALLLGHKKDIVAKAARTALERIGTPEAKAALSRKRWPF